jgi:hypothetical protein
MFQAERLVGETHVHDAGGMSFGRCQVYQSAFTQEMKPSSVS